MKKITFLLFIICALLSETMQAQVYKRIIGMDSLGYFNNFPPQLHSGFRFTYPNNNVGNREEARLLYVYHTFPYHNYLDCYAYNLFKFATIEDTMGGYDSTHYLSRTSNALLINNKDKVLTANGLPTAYYNGSDTLSRFYYNSNGQIISEVYKVNQLYGIKEVTYQYNNLNQLSSIFSKDNYPNYFYSFFKYNGSGIMIERIDSSLINNNSNGSTFSTYVYRHQYKQVGLTTIVNHNYGSSSNDDSMFFNASGLITKVTYSSPSTNTIMYYYDSDNYLDSVVYYSPSQTDKVRLYWETYTPNSSAISSVHSTTGQIAVFPNPTMGNLNIELKMQGSSMIMTNALGQQVMKANLQKGMNTIDVQHLAKGVYFVRLNELNECRQIVIE